MRSMNSLKNILSNFANSLVLNLLRFGSRIIFVKVLSEVYLGVNGLLSNVLGLLALAELGIGTAISYSLYKPLLDKNVEKCQTLMKFYKKAYRFIAMIVLVAGLALLPFLPWFIKDVSGVDNLSLIYLIFLGNMVIGYLFSYKRTLIIADQKNYKITPFLIFFNFFTTILQIIILLVFKDYILYLLIQTVCIVLENVTVNWYITKAYPYLKNINNSEKLDKGELLEIKTNIKALMLHKVGTYVLSATDNIVISKFIGLATVGLYSNYVLIHTAISSFIYTFVSNITASFGNLIAEGDKKKSYRIFKELDFLTYCLYGVSALCLLFVFNPFIELVFGAKFVLPFIVVVLIILNYYVVGINQVPITVQAASGIYKYDKFIPLLEAIINVILSVTLVHFIGLAGVLVGTFISYLLPLIIKPVIIFKYVFEEKVGLYFNMFLKQFLVLLVSALIILGLLQFIVIDSLVIQIIVNLILSLVIPIVMIIIFYRKTDELKNAQGRFKFMIQKIRK